MQKIQKQNQNNMAAWIAPVVAAGASLLGNLFGSSSNKKTNETNMQIAQMNNEFNERMMNKQMAYNTEMWNKQNDYNSAVNQRKRLEDAGLNPYLMMNGGSAGVAQSAGGVSPAQAQAVQMNPYQYDFSGIGQAAMQWSAMQMQKEKIDADNRLTHLQSDYYAARASAEIENIKAQTDSHTAKTYWQKVQNKYAEGLAQSAYDNQILRNQEIDERIKNMAAQTNLISKELAIFDERTRIGIAKMAAEEQLAVVQGRKTKNEAATEIYRKLEINARIQGLKVNNYVLRRTADSLVEKARYDAYYKVGGPFDFINRIGQRIDTYMK